MLKKVVYLITILFLLIQVTSCKSSNDFRELLEKSEINSEDTILHYEKFGERYLVFAHGKIHKNTRGLKAYLISYEDEIYLTKSAGVVSRSNNIPIVEASISYQNNTKSISFNEDDQNKRFIFGYIEDPLIEKIKVKTHDDNFNEEYFNAKIIGTNIFRIWYIDRPIDITKDYVIYGYDKNDNLSKLHISIQGK